jgi:hypothetical protein
MLIFVLRTKSQAVTSPDSDRCDNEYNHKTAHGQRPQRRRALHVNSRPDAANGCCWYASSAIMRPTAAAAAAAAARVSIKTGLHQIRTTAGRNQHIVHVSVPQGRPTDSGLTADRVNRIAAVVLVLDIG